MLVNNNVADRLTQKALWNTIERHIWIVFLKRFKIKTELLDCKEPHLTVGRAAARCTLTGPLLREQSIEENENQKPWNSIHQYQPY